MRTVEITAMIAKDYDDKKICKPQETVKFGLGMLDFSFITYFTCCELPKWKLCLNQIYNPKFKSYLAEEHYMADISALVNILITIGKIQNAKLFCIFTAIMYWKWDF